MNENALNWLDGTGAFDRVLMINKMMGVRT